MSTTRRIAVSWAALACASCGFWRSGQLYVPDAPSEDVRLERFLEEAFQSRLDRDPELATRAGDRRNQTRWTDRSAAFAKSESEHLARGLGRVREAFDRGDLHLEGRLHHRAFEIVSERALASGNWRLHAQGLPSAVGIGREVERFLVEAHRIESEPEALAWIERVRALPGLFAQVNANLHEAAEQEIFPSKVFLDEAIAHCRAMHGLGPLPGSLMQHFEGALGALQGLDEARRESLVASARAALQQAAAPAYRELEATFSELLETASEEVGLWRLPAGAAFYAHLLARASGGKSPQEVNRLALDEVERLEDELRGTMDRTGLAESLDAFFERVRTEPAGYATPDEAGRAALLERVRGHLDAIGARLDEIVPDAPEAALEVRARTALDAEVPAGEALFAPRLLDRRAAFAWVLDLGRLELLPLASIEALTYRRAVPGEFLSRTIARETASIPRLFLLDPDPVATAAWAAYAELLPLELGFYREPASELGRLLAALSRAARMVADTGIHARRWSSERARNYLLEHGADHELACAAAVDQILRDPGASVAPVVGGQKILELRARAKRRLGASFDLRGFHAVILQSGPLPLQVIEQRVEAWIATELP